ncbi:DUF2268 domain-containing putative Zn-dependent protease [Thalassotalea euphylliae]|uniref:DUF2268 domain-containing putative Zn-dependent protease n=1 Tax=Thalassotalea euphylliae TaxID=1655234 RepID=UPI00363696ED
MKKILTSIFGLAALLAFTTVSASNAINTSAVTQLIELKKTSPTLPEQLLNEQLLANGTGGLAMLRGRFQNAENLQHFYASLSEKDWVALQQCAASLTALASEFNDLKAKLTKLTGVSLSDVKAYGVVGAGNTAATASPKAIVLGLEMICASGEDSVDSALTLENYLAHELVHVVQYRLTTRTDFRFNLLEISLLEGSADYVADILLDDDYILDDARIEFGERKGSELLESFEPVMQSYDYAPWFYTPVEGKPMDMGYWVGFKLAQAFIKGGGTLLELLTLDDATAIYRRSNLK